jgi:hypothetical protein
LHYHPSIDALSTAWVLLAYRLPREPSTPRIALWRRLRRLGAAQLVDGLVALPLSPSTRESLEWLADEVLEAGGEATVWLSEPAQAADGRALAERMRAAAAEEYLSVAAGAAGRREGRRSLAALRRSLRDVRGRDYFDAPGRAEAEAAVEAIARQLEAAA